MIKRLIGIILAAMCATAICHYSAKLTAAQSVGVTGAEQIRDLHFKEATLLEVLNTLAVNYRIPIGLQKSGTQFPHDINLDVDSESLSAILSQAIAQVPNYRWLIRDGVVNVVPLDSSEELTDLLLSCKIANYDANKGFRNFNLRDSILSAPEIQAFFKEHGLKANHFSSGFRRSVYYNLTMEMHVKDSTVRDLFNQIVLKTEFMIWIVELQDAKPTRYILISL